MIIRRIETLMTPKLPLSRHHPKMVVMNVSMCYEIGGFVPP
jgi:hypothetical protein